MIVSSAVRRNAALAVCAIAGFGPLTACGSDSGAAGPEQSAVSTLIVRHYATPSCADLTASGRTAFGHPVEDAGWAKDLAKQAPKKVTVSAVRISGDTGTAVADGFTFKVVKVDGAWLIDGGA